jgi:hypothetical protein
LQLLRLFFGFISAFFIAEQVFIGPVDTILLLANFNLWGLIATFFTMLFQYKSSNYEVEKATAESQGLYVAVYYPYSTWYKRIALRFLEASLSLNFITLLAFYVFIIPNTGVDFYKSSLDEAFGSNIYSNSYFFVRNILVHTVPFVSTIFSIFMADIVFLESDWWLNVDIAVGYLFVNYAVMEYSGTDQIYYLNWADQNGSIGAYTPVFTTFLFGTIAFGMHFMMCLITQVSHQRFESNFGDLITAEE